MSKHYAKGAFRRIAEEQHGEQRHYGLREYDSRPTSEEIVEDMVGHGFEESVARSSVQTLWDDEFRDHAS